LTNPPSAETINNEQSVYGSFQEQFIDNIAFGFSYRPRLQGSVGEAERAADRHCLA
jgi:hypothetical protein